MNQSTGGRPAAAGDARDALHEVAAEAGRDLGVSWVTRMTVSAPETFASAIASTGRAPKSRVAVRLTGLSGSSPGPTPHPPRPAATALPAAARSPSALLPDMEDDAVAAAPASVVAVARLVDGLDVEHVAPAAQLLRQQVVDLLAVADREPAPGRPRTARA